MPPRKATEKDQGEEKSPKKLKTEEKPEAKAKAKAERKPKDPEAKAKKDEQNAIYFQLKQLAKAGNPKPLETFESLPRGKGPEAARNLFLQQFKLDREKAKLKALWVAGKTLPPLCLGRCGQGLGNLYEKGAAW
jgi:hypothetical protein